MRGSEAEPFLSLLSAREQEQSMSQLQLSLLGVPVVQHGERTLTFSTRKALALLVYLAVEGGTHTRKTLSESFWSELDAEHGRAALRAYADCRDVLADELQIEPEPETVALAERIRRTDGLRERHPLSASLHCQFRRKIEAWPSRPCLIANRPGA